MYMYVFVKGGDSPLIWACRIGHSRACMDLLISAGCNVDIKNEVRARPGREGGRGVDLVIL